METGSLALLGEVALNIEALRKAKKRFSERLAPEFSIFDYLRADEMALSKCIAGLLAPQGTHGQGSVYLRSFLESVCPQTSWITSTEQCEVETEKQANGQRRIDVFLSFQEGFVGIENKPWAADQDRQLIDYAEYLEKSANSSGKQWLLIYLCNNEPSKESVPEDVRENLETSGNLIFINYIQLINWLDVCRSKTKALSVQVFIEELIKFIQIKINGELEMSEENETCAIILSSKVQLSSAFQIYKSIDVVKRDLIIKLREQLKFELEKKDYHLVWDKDLELNWKAYVGFGVKFKKDQDVYLRFEFNNTGLCNFEWGLARESKAVIPHPVRWKTIKDSMESHQFGMGKEAPHWPWYVENTKSGLGDEIRDWNKDYLPWTLILDDGENNLAKRVASLSSRVHKAFAENMSVLLPSTV